VGVLDGIFDTVSTLLKGQVDKRTMLENLELILLTIDEAVRGGVLCVCACVCVCEKYANPFPLHLLTLTY
jgi:hypothetical protein